MRERGTPAQWHVKSRHIGEIEDCWYCQQARAKCRSKLRFDSVEDADASVTDFNEAHGYRKPVVRYPCRWCPGWHMATARGRFALRRAEKQRRRWLARKRGVLSDSTLGEDERS